MIPKPYSSQLPALNKPATSMKTSSPAYILPNSRIARLIGLEISSIRFKSKLNGASHGPNGTVKSSCKTPPKPFALKLKNSTSTSTVKDIANVSPRSAKPAIALEHILDLPIDEFQRQFHQRLGFGGNVRAGAARYVPKPEAEQKPQRQRHSDRVDMPRPEAAMLRADGPELQMVLNIFGQAAFGIARHAFQFTRILNANQCAA
ncbi:hypothetical protein RF55_19169 [Lasius niger]|uniref:Uncharacterized protein n=1 Tax=Lasius niger TaxID=67767 RepID=A0A0J7K0R7_LASNI|nr:hypothetical protein RF55_19169 [Lasius niger]